MTHSWQNAKLIKFVKISVIGCIFALPNCKNDIKSEAVDTSVKSEHESELHFPFLCIDQKVPFSRGVDMDISYVSFHAENEKLSKLNEELLEIFEYVKKINDVSYDEYSTTISIMRLEPKSERDSITKKLSLKDFDILYKMIEKSELSQSAYFSGIEEMKKDYKKWGYGSKGEF